MKLYTRADFEAEFEPKNLNRTLLKVLLLAAFISLLTWIYGWERYSWPPVIIIIYYVIRIALVKIRMRRNQER